jgi:hypothetical protein
MLQPEPSILSNGDIGSTWFPGGKMADMSFAMILHLAATDAVIFGPGGHF